MRFLIKSVTRYQKDDYVRLEPINNLLSGWITARMALGLGRYYMRVLISEPQFFYVGEKRRVFSYNVPLCKREEEETVGGKPSPSPSGLIYQKSSPNVASLIKVFQRCSFLSLVTQWADADSMRRAKKWERWLSAPSQKGRKLSEGYKTLDLATRNKKQIQMRPEYLVGKWKLNSLGRNSFH